MLDDISVKAGDEIQFSLVTSNATAGFVTIRNTESGEFASIPVSGPALCGQGAEWMVELAPTSNGTYIPLANFGVLNFKGAVAGLKNGGAADPTSSDAVLYDLVRNGTRYTETAVGRFNARIRYAQ